MMPTNPSATHLALKIFATNDPDDIKALLNLDLQIDWCAQDKNGTPLFIRAFRVIKDETVFNTWMPLLKRELPSFSIWTETVNGHRLINEVFTKQGAHSFKLNQLDWSGTGQQWDTVLNNCVCRYSLLPGFINVLANIKEYIPKDVYKKIEKYHLENSFLSAGSEKEFNQLKPTVLSSHQIAQLIVMGSQKNPQKQFSFSGDKDLWLIQAVFKEKMALTSGDVQYVANHAPKGFFLPIISAWDQSKSWNKEFADLMNKSCEKAVEFWKSVKMDSSPDMVDFAYETVEQFICLSKSIPEFDKKFIKVMSDALDVSNFQEGLPEKIAFAKIMLEYKKNKKIVIKENMISLFNECSVSTSDTFAVNKKVFDEHFKVFLTAGWCRTLNVSCKGSFKKECTKLLAMDKSLNRNAIEDRINAVCQSMEFASDTQKKIMAGVFWENVCVLSSVQQFAVLKKIAGINDFIVPYQTKSPVEKMLLALSQSSRDNYEAKAVVSKMILSNSVANHLDKVVPSQKKRKL